MREIGVDGIGEALRKLLDEDAPIDEDIGIVGMSGQLLGVIITPDAYDFFLRKVEEEEGRIDLASIQKFDESGEKDA